MKVVLHRLRDWPAARHLLPVLRNLGVTDDALELVHYYYPKSIPDPLEALEEIAGDAAVDAALLAASSALATTYSELVDTDELRYGFHRSAPDSVLARAFEAANLDVVRVPRTPTKPAPFSPERAAISLKYALPAKLRKPVLDYVIGGGRLPDLPHGKPLTDFLTSDLVESWTAEDGRMLDVFVALTRKERVPRWTYGTSPETTCADRAGLLADALRERGVRDDVLLEALRRGEFGRSDWVSPKLLVASWFDRLDRVDLDALIARVHREDAADLFGLAARAVLPKAKLRLESWRRLVDWDDEVASSLANEALLAHRKQALAKGADLETLEGVFRDQDEVGNFSSAEAKTFAKRREEALARDDYTLETLVGAQSTDGLLTPTDFEAHAPRAFARFVKTGFKNASGFGAQAEFMAAAPLVAEHDPDLCMRGFVALADCFNEHGLRDHAAKWDAVLPMKGISNAQREELSTHFSRPTKKSAAKILGKLLTKRGVMIRPAKPTPVASLDVTLHVGTDVALLVLGSYDAVERVSDQEDLDDFLADAKKEKCIGIETGGDGRYAVRITGRRIEGLGKPDERRPLVIRDDALTLSGVVGAGGTPTVAVPSGKYAAEIHWPQGERTEYVIVLSR